MGFFAHLRGLLGYLQLPKDRRRLTFYSEGRNYWPHLEGLVRKILAVSNIPVCYISSGDDDPGLTLEHPNFQAFKIDDGFIRNWLFENLDTEVMVMTMPDLHQYQVKRSRHKVHYVYVQHSLVSLHMVYRKGAFDHFDTVFCAGPHHVKEVRAMEATYQLPPKKLVEHGYARLDSIIAAARAHPPHNADKAYTRHVLIAPSWGPRGIIESGAAHALVDDLIGRGHRVSLRPHPQTVKFAAKMIDAISRKHSQSPLFELETNVAGQESLFESDVMISDWSGAALDYAFGLGKPVIFVDVPRKINNPDYEQIGIEPFEVHIRGEIGSIISPDTVHQELDNLLTTSPEFGAYVFNPGNSDAVGASYLIKLLEK